MISNNSMVTSQDIGMSQYEMESSGVFSDADPGRKSSLFFDQKNESHPRSTLEPELSVLPTTLPELAEETDSRLDLVKVGGAVGGNVDGNVDDVFFDVHHVDEQNTAEDKENCLKEETVLRRERTFVTESSRIEKPVHPTEQVHPVVKPRPRSQESKGLATRRSELLQEKPIMPNTNVGSKLKEILSRQPNPSERSGWHFLS